jgi:hypothetical protein
MPTKHRRVSVSVDGPLAEALERARRLHDDGDRGEGARLGDATLIHDLAIDGARRLERQVAERRRLLDELADPRLTVSRLNADALREVLAQRDASPLGGTDAD